MPPKVKITKKEIIDAAITLTRESGEGGLNARAIAKHLCASTQPIFSNFPSMSALLEAVIERATEIYNQYVKREVESGKYPVYKANGMAYIRFASEEKELFKLLFMRNRTKSEMHAEDKLTEGVFDIVSANTGLSGDGVKLFHLEMWACVHGVATMLVTGYFEPSEELISRILSDTYIGLRQRYGIGD